MTKEQIDRRTSSAPNQPLEDDEPKYVIHCQYHPYNVILKKISKRGGIFFYLNDGK